MSGTRKSASPKPGKSRATHSSPSFETRGGGPVLLSSTTKSPGFVEIQVHRLLCLVGCESTSQVTEIAVFSPIKHANLNLSWRFRFRARQPKSPAQVSRAILVRNGAMEETRTRNNTGPKCADIDMWLCGGEIGAQAVHSRRSLRDSERSGISGGWRVQVVGWGLVSKRRDWVRQRALTPTSPCSPHTERYKTIRSRWAAQHHGQHQHHGDAL